MSTVSVFIRYGEKQGGIVTWLVDAAKTGNASFIDNCTVQRVTRKVGYFILNKAAF